jgi:diguanylate cyclase (GGDEF)-like protein
VGRIVISLKKYMDMDASELNKHREAGADELLPLILESYRSSLGAMGNCGVQTCSALGAELERGLAVVAERLAKKITPPIVKETETQVKQQLEQWGGRAAEYFQQRAGDVKEILMVLAHAAESSAERDQRYTQQFGEFTKRLQAMAKLEDLPQLRAAVMRGARELKVCVDKMEQDGRQSVAALRAQVSTYQTKLEEAEQLACRDTLTGLDNRHGIETKMGRRIAAKHPFCVVMLDLNGFKQVNDSYGHLVGDDLLKQFSAELRSASRSTDAVGRWGGDEFIVVMEGGLTEAQSHLERMQKWVFGGYTVQLEGAGPKVDMDAAVGMVEWQPGETIKQVLGRADAIMYQQKAIAHKHGPAPATARVN